MLWSRSCGKKAWKWVTSKSSIWLFRKLRPLPVMRESGSLVVVFSERCSSSQLILRFPIIISEILQVRLLARLRYFLWIDLLRRILFLASSVLGHLRTRSWTSRVLFCWFSVRRRRLQILSSQSFKVSMRLLLDFILLLRLLLQLRLKTFSIRF